MEVAKIGPSFSPPFVHDFATRWQYLWNKTELYTLDNRKMALETPYDDPKFHLIMLAICWMHTGMTAQTAIITQRIYRRPSIDANHSAGESRRY